MPYANEDCAPRGRRLARLVATLAVGAAALAGQQDAVRPDKMEPVTVGGGPRRSFSGVFPHLASFNRQNECGTGAVVAWQDRLWWLTYAPHRPRGSDDLLYAMDRDRNLYTYPGSVGGTPANRLVHRESNQLLIGPYLIDAERSIRVLPSSVMFGRLTGTARHLVEPASKVYYATMEEGIYSVDVRTLGVEELFADSQQKGDRRRAGLPGYHGKGLYSGQGRLIYSNNGEYGQAAQTRPETPSGVLASWPGQGAFEVVQRNQFTEVTGPGGIYGNANPAEDPVWSVGWDHRSVILMVLDGGAWHRYRLPKASHCYDGAHGWNTEWPRIRSIGTVGEKLMTMHGAFWRFPSSFGPKAAAGIRMRSSYLKVVGDFCRYGADVVLGCDDAARSEFLNKRSLKGEVVGPAESQSNLWFVSPKTLDALGPRTGRGAVWVRDAVRAGVPSDPHLFAGFARRGLHLAHDSDESVTFRVERSTPSGWVAGGSIVVPPRSGSVESAGYRFTPFASDAPGEFLRLIPDRNCRATAVFAVSDGDRRWDATADRLQALADREDPGAIGGWLRAGSRSTGLEVIATRRRSDRLEITGYYRLTPELRLVRVDDSERLGVLRRQLAVSEAALTAGREYVEVREDGEALRLPVFGARRSPGDRIAREVVTERDLMHVGGTFYELPARNAGGLSKVRAIASHQHWVQDFCSWRGLMVLTGLRSDEGRDDRHVIRSADGKCAVWLGAIDDLWSLGKPVGDCALWSGQRVADGARSPAGLLSGFDSVTVEWSASESARAVAGAIEIDITGTGAWHVLRQVSLTPGQISEFELPRDLGAYRVRCVSRAPARMTAILRCR